jgi:hypothetical protein
MYQLFSDEIKKIVYVILLQHSLMFCDVIYVCVVYKYKSAADSEFVVVLNIKGEKHNY